MIKIAFVFRHSPFSTSHSREGLDALLAATAFCAEDEIGVFFMDDGVLNLQAGQAEKILQKDISRTFKLLDLYEINQRYVCQQSLQRFAFMKPIIDVQVQDRHTLLNQLRQAEKILTF